MAEVEARAPQGSIRLVGREHNNEWTIGDFPDNTPESELWEVAHFNRGVGIEIFAYNDEGKCLFSA